MQAYGPVSTPTSEYMYYPSTYAETSDSGFRGSSVPYGISGLRTGGLTNRSKPPFARHNDTPADLPPGWGWTPAPPRDDDSNVASSLDSALLAQERAQVFEDAEQQIQEDQQLLDNVQDRGRKAASLLLAHKMIKRRQDGRMQRYGEVSLLSTTLPHPSFGGLLHDSYYPARFFSVLCQGTVASFRPLLAVASFAGMAVACIRFLLYCGSRRGMWARATRVPMCTYKYGPCVQVQL